MADSKGFEGRPGRPKKPSHRTRAPITAQIPKFIQKKAECKNCYLHCRGDGPSTQSSRHIHMQCMSCIHKHKTSLPKHRTTEIKCNCSHPPSNTINHNPHVMMLVNPVKVLRPTLYASRLVDSCTLLKPACSSSHARPATVARGHCCTQSLCRDDSLCVHAAKCTHTMPRSNKLPSKAFKDR